MSRLADFLDAAIEAVSPTWGAHRRLARMALVQSEKLSVWRDSTQRRLDRNLTSRGMSDDDELELYAAAA